MKLKLPDSLPREKIEEWAHDTITKEYAEVELWRRYFRKMSRQDLWFHCKEVLGFKDLDVDFHGPRLDERSEWPIREDGTPYPIVADFWPRGGFKTSTLTVGRGTQLYLRCPEETFLIEHGVRAKSEAILKEIREHFESNAILRWAFPDLTWQNPRSQSKKWTNTQLDLPHRGKYKESTFTASSPESEETGGHWTTIILDDLVCEENCGTEDMLDKIYEHFKKVLLLQDQRWIGPDDPRYWPWFPRKGVEVFFKVAIVATRWDIRDTNSRIIDPTNAAYRGQVHHRIEPAVRRPPKYANEELDIETLMEVGESFFERKYPMWRLREMKNQMGSFLFSAQMQQDPYPSDAMLFRKKDLRYWKVDNLPKKLWFYTAVDPNNKSDDYKSDFGVVVTIGIDTLGNIYIMRISRDHFTPRDQITEILRHVKIFKPRRVAIEAAGYQESLAFWLREAMKTHPELRTPIQPLPRGGRSSEAAKHNRILKLQPYLEQRRVYANKEEAWYPIFEQELTQYPRGKRDQLDALCDAISISRIPPVNTEAVQRFQQQKKHKVSVPEEVGGRSTIFSQTGDEVLNGLRAAGVDRVRSPHRPTLQPNQLMKKIGRSARRLNYGS